MGLNLKSMLGLASLSLKPIMNSQITPYLQKLPYKILYLISGIVLKNLSELKNKILNEQNDEKKQRHLKGFYNGLTCIGAICNVLLDMVNSLKADTKSPIIKEK